MLSLLLLVADLLHLLLHLLTDEALLQRSKLFIYFHDSLILTSPCRKPSKSSSPQKRAPVDNHTTKIDPKLGAPKKTAGVRNLPKIEKTGSRRRERSRKESGRSGTGDSDTSSHSGVSGDFEQLSVGEGSSRRSANSSVKDLDTVEEETVDN